MDPSDMVQRGPMLARRGDTPPDNHGYFFEVKWDGMRALVWLQEQKTRIYTRRGREVGTAFPELQNLHIHCLGKAMLLDGEVICVEEGRPSFALLQSRFQSCGLQALKAARRAPALYVPFDLLWDGEDQTQKPLEERKELLTKQVQGGEGLQPSSYVQGEGRAYLTAIKKAGLEGMVAKERSSPYVLGKRSAYWIKYPLRQKGLFLFLGYTTGRDGREPVSFIIGEMQGQTVVVLGTVAANVQKKEKEQARLLCARAPALPPRGWEKKQGWVWTRPRQYMLLEYLEKTGAGSLRHAAFRGFSPGASVQT